MVEDPTEMIKPKRTRFLNKLTSSPRNLPDEVLRNIVSRLSSKPLMRFKCVSTYWNSQITDSYFKSHRKILFSNIILYALNDENVYSYVKLPFPSENYQPWRKAVVVGTLNGIVVLALERGTLHDIQLILYNPLTRATNKLRDPPRSCCIPARIRRTPRAYGFGYGYEATPDDSKIIIAYDELYCDCVDKSHNKYHHVFSLKRGFWTTPITDFPCSGIFQEVGVFLNGYLHWITLHRGLEILGLDVEEMKVSRINAPDCTNRLSSRLGTLHGCLCMVTKRHSGYNVWVMKTKRYNHEWWLRSYLWSKEYSFTVGIERDYYNKLNTICILDDGRIVVMDSTTHHLIFYDPSKRSQNVFKCANRMVHNYLAIGIEYVESLASPSDICYFRNRNRVR